MQVREPHKHALSAKHHPQPAEKVPLVSYPDACSRDRAVVVHAVHAPVAHRAVFRTQRPSAVTRVAKLTGVYQVVHDVLRKRDGKVVLVLARVRHLSDTITRGVASVGPTLLLLLQRLLRDGRARDASHVPHPLVPPVGGERYEPRTEVIGPDQERGGGDERHQTHDAPPRVRRPPRWDVHERKL